MNKICDTHSATIVYNQDVLPQLPCAWYMTGDLR